MAFPKLSLPANNGEYTIRAFCSEISKRALIRSTTFLILTRARSTRVFVSMTAIAAIAFEARSNRHRHNLLNAISLLELPEHHLKRCLKSTLIEHLECTPIVRQRNCETIPCS